ncbi:hypothetical protein MNBD_GAMMA10-2636 [hydrothermal vent metagenome]|uniref:Thioredoxin domain-containing protein n=1 Tax=hydrothermal vent metagenome TaxID=652676 RepID=A0A3B0YEX0_9ZZZZ
MSRLKQLSSVYKRSRVVRFFAQILLLLMVYFVLRYWQGRDDIQGMAPIIQAVQLNGEAYDLAAHRGKPVLVHFWATWCAICEFESANIAALAKDYQVISVATWAESKREVVQYLRKEGLELPVIVDVDQHWAKQYAIKAVPYSFIVDRYGRIRFVEKGYSSELGLRARMWWLEMFD